MWSTLILSADAPKIFLESEDSAVPVESTGFWKQVESPGFANDSNTPPGMLAARIGQNGVMFNWKPSPDSSSLAGDADLTAVLLSADESTLIFCERIGGVGRNNSSRLVFLNLFSGRICGGFELPLRRITGLALLPGDPEMLLAVQEGQENCGNGNQILKIDLIRKRVVASSTDFEQKIGSLQTNGEQVWFSLEKRSQFGELPVGDLRSAVRFHECKGEVRKLFAGRAGAVIAVGRGICEFFTMRYGRLYLNNAVALPDGFNISWGMPVQKGSDSLIMTDREGRALYVSAGGHRFLNGRMENHGCLLPDQTFLLGSSERKRLNRLVFPDGSVTGHIEPNSLRPHSINKTRWLFARTTSPIQVLQVDNRGNVFKITLTGRRGRKEAVLITDKSGIK